LYRKGFAVPQTLVCNWAAYRRWTRGDLSVLGELRSELAQALDPETAYAVRSSANVEDVVTHSFAGQFRTILDIRGVDAIVEAIEQVWSQVRSPQMRAYMQKAGLDEAEIAMAVLIQEYDPGTHLVKLHRQYATHGSAVQTRLSESGYGALEQLGAQSFRAALDRFLGQFGHLSDSGNDFSTVPWRETPDLVLDMVRHYPEPSRRRGRRAGRTLGLPHTMGGSRTKSAWRESRAPTGFQPNSKPGPTLSRDSQPRFVLE
jgi:hypothetical protein